MESGGQAAGRGQLDTSIGESNEPTSLGGESDMFDRGRSLGVSCGEKVLTVG